MRRKKRRSRSTAKCVIVTNRSYGARLKGTKIYYEGKKPKGLKKDGSIQFGKHILETLVGRFGKKFRWIITEDTDAIARKYGIHRVQTSSDLLSRMSREFWDRTRDIKNDIVRKFFAASFPDKFRGANTTVYVPGQLAQVLSEDISAKLSSEDKEALQKFLPQFIASESIKSVNLLKAATQIQSLKELAAALEQAIGERHGESWWQTFIREKILVIQQGYIQAIEKMNIAIGNTKFPDFSLVTHDNYLDILEIKRPDTKLVRLDPSRSNYHADTEIAKAIIQVENYIENVLAHKNDVRSYILDEYKLNLKVVRPRGIILAGNAGEFETQKEKDDFRLLAHGLKNITIVTYDELLTRLNNYIKVLESAVVEARRTNRKKNRRTS